MTKFRKKPIVVEAEQWHGDKVGPAICSVRYYRSPDDPGERACERCGLIMHVHGWIDTLEGGHTVCPNDWIITGVAGEYYPCKPDIFEATYESV